MELYALESAILRGRKRASQGKDVSLERELVSVLAVDAVEKVGRAGREALCHISEGDDLRMQLAGLKRFTKPLSIDAASARRTIAQLLAERGGYRI